MLVTLMTQPVVQLRPRRRPALVTLDQRARSLAEGLKAKEEWAERRLVDEHTDYVERVVQRIVGDHSDIDDLVQEVFIRALGRVEQLWDDQVRQWLGAFAVNVAREAVRKRRRWRWLMLLPAESTPEPASTSASPETAAAMAALYKLLDQMDPDDRVAFALRVIDGMDLAEIAVLCDTSLSTVKRRVKRGEDWLRKRASRDACLAEWVTP